ncbi:MAG: DUF3107 domain-containing protein [Dermabacter sp.]|nr:DUF3107 domain-containing protein [Dermabacter sp.]
MEIRIGVQHSPRELTLTTDLSPEELSAKVASAIADGSLLSLTDVKSRSVLVPGERISYVEYSTEEPRRVGFLG